MPNPISHPTLSTSLVGAVREPPAPAAHTPTPTITPAKAGIQSSPSPFTPTCHSEEAPRRRISPQKLPSSTLTTRRGGSRTALPAPLPTLPTTTLPQTQKNFGIVVFPGSWSDSDCHHALGSVLNQQPRYLWHKETSFSNVDCIILPGGFSYGDYLRPGAIARLSPIMSAVAQFAAKGGLVLGICNGFQMLCEAGLLPGVLMRNNHLQFRCQWTNLRVERNDTPFTQSCSEGQVLHVPISHGEGSYYADAPTLDRLESEGRVLFRYCTPQGEISPDSNPNGSLNNIAGITNKQGNVLGMMPHPERCCEEIMGGADGLSIFGSIIQSLKQE